MGTPAHENEGHLRDRLAAELAVCEAATEGPWEWERGPLGQPRELPGVLGVRVLTYPDEPDAEFIAAARTGYPLALRALQAVMEKASRMTVYAESTDYWGGVRAAGDEILAALNDKLGVDDER